MKILITGTAGFVGFHLANRLLDENFEVVGLDSINDYYDVNVKYNRLTFAGINRAIISYNHLVQSDKHINYQFIQLLMEDRENLHQLFAQQNFDVVVNLAAQAGVRYSLTNPYAYIDSNIVGFLNILEGCRHHQVKHLVYASSSSVYGLNEQNPFSTHDPVNHPISLYAVSKKSNEMMAHTYSHLYRLPTTGLRFFTVYGSWGRPDMALFLFTKAIIEGKPIEVFNNGEMTRDFTYIDDITEGIKRVIENPAKPNPFWDPMWPDPATSSAPFQLYNIGNNNPVKLLDFVKAIEKELGKKANIILKPIQPGDVPSTYANVQDLVTNLGYQPQTSIETGIKIFIDWYRSYYNTI